MRAKLLSVLMFATGLALVGCREDAPALDQTGYFKSGERDRVMAYHGSAPISEAQARGMLANLTWTAGRISRAVIYSSDDNAGPADVLTLAPDLRRALEVTVTPPHDDWDWMLIVNPGGERTLKGR